MVYDVLLQSGLDKVRATVLGWPDCTVEGETEEVALQRIREAIRERLSAGKIVRVEVVSPAVPHPWQQFAGMWRDDPTFEEFLTELAAYRQQIETAT